MRVKTPKAMPPSPWVVECAKEIPPDAAVLDVACGAGRHSLYLRDRGHRVTAMDRATEAVAHHHDIDVITVDLENGSPWPLPGRLFGGVVVVNYLFRPLFPHLLSSVAPGGVLIYDTFMIGNERYGRPSNPDFLLKPGELKDIATDAFDILHFEEGLMSGDAPAIKQRICAQKR